MLLIRSPWNHPNPCCWLPVWFQGSAGKLSLGCTFEPSTFQLFKLMKRFLEMHWWEVWINEELMPNAWKLKKHNTFNFYYFFPEETDDDIENSLDSVQCLVPFLFDLAKFSPQPSGEAVRSVLQEKYDDFCKTSKTYPGLDSVSRFFLHSKIITYFLYWFLWKLISIILLPRYVWMYQKITLYGYTAVATSVLTRHIFHTKCLISEGRGRTFQCIWVIWNPKPVPVWGETLNFDILTLGNP